MSQPPSAAYPPPSQHPYAPYPSDPPYGAPPAGGYPPPPAGAYRPGMQPSLSSDTSVGWVIAGFLLFWPTALPALFASQRAAAAVGAGDLVTASEEAARAKKWGITSLCIWGGLLALQILAIVVFFGMMGAAFSALFSNMPD